MRMILMSKSPFDKPNSKYSVDIHAKLVDCIRAGNFRITAAKLVGLNRKTLYEWMRRKDVPEYKQLKADILRAEAEVEAHYVELILNSSKKEPKWAAWWLERKANHWNGMVHRYEYLALHKQVKELKGVISKLTGTQETNLFLEDPNFKPTVSTLDCQTDNPRY